MRWLEIVLEIFVDSMQRLHRLHVWVLFPLFGLLIGSLLRVWLFNRTQSMLLGAVLGFWLGFRIAKWHLKP